MSQDYQKLYAYLVGEVDGALQMIAKGYAEQADKERLLLTVGEKLKAALLAAEEGAEPPKNLFLASRAPNVYSVGETQRSA